MLGAAGKSAQIPLYVWLPDAMEGPTPVSALIHAATMVTAGVYMVARCHVLFDHSPFALEVVAIIGAATAIFAACIGMVQHDIKRVLAYSTVSQLGYMFMACGVAAYSAGIFHLVTHAFFKGLLFLAAGSVIHAMGGEQDMRFMGGLRTRIPITFWTMSAGVFAIAGIWPFAGFFSKDEILYRAFTFAPNPQLGHLLWAIGLLTAGMTSFYMFRLWFKTFFRAPRFDEAHLGEHAHDPRQAASHPHHVHESPWTMLTPLVILAILSVVGGWIGVPQALHGANHFEHFLAAVLPSTTSETGSAHLEIVLAGISLCAAAIGFFFAWLFYWRTPLTAARVVTRMPASYAVLNHKFFIDELYHLLIVTPLLMLSRVMEFLIDTAIVNGVPSAAAATTRGLGSLTRRMQSGNIRSYAGWLAFGAAAVIAAMLFGRTLWFH